MALSTSQRFGAYFIGVGLGCVVASIIWSIHGLPHAPELPPPGTIRREAPGALSQWVQNHQHIQGEFVLSQSDDLHAASHEGGQTTRCVVVKGLDEGAFIRVEEKSTLANPEVVTDWKYMFADHVRVKLVATAFSRELVEAMRPLGWRFLGGAAVDGWLIITLDTHEARSVPEAVTKLKSWPQWVADAEPDYLPAPVEWHGR